MIINIKKNGSASIEFLIVVIMLFIILMILVDTFLFFRQIYLVQAFNDEVFTRISMRGVCANTAIVSGIISNDIPIIIYFNNPSELIVENEGNKLYRYRNDRYMVNIKCKNNSVIESAFTESFYNGLFMFKNKTVSSSITSTLSYY